MRLIYITILSMFSMALCAEPAPLRIALVAPLSGSYAGYGTQILAGAMQACTDINDKGGLRGIKLEIVPLDDQCDPDHALRQAEHIVSSQEYHAVIGHVCSAAALATANIYAKAKILVITPSATNPKLTERHINTLFRMIGTDHSQGIAAAEFISKSLHSKRIAVLHDSDLYSKDLADIVCEHLSKLGISPVLYEEVPRGSRNFTKLVKKMKQLKADAVYFAGLYPEVSSLATTMHALNLQIPFMSADGVALKKFVQESGGPLIGNSVLMSFATEPHTLLSSKTVINKMHKNNLETNGYALYAYAAVQVIATATVHSNNMEGTALANWLHQHEVETILGKKSWDTNGDINNTEFKIYSWRGDTEMHAITS